jgi:RHS repeat-associated protein
MVRGEGMRYLGSENQNLEESLDYALARWQDPETGRFTSLDPARDGINWYVYCAGNPIGYTDPTGLFDPRGFSGLQGAAWVGPASIDGGSWLTGSAGGSAGNLGTWGATGNSLSMPFSMNMFPSQYCDSQLAKALPLVMAVNELSKTSGGDNKPRVADPNTPKATYTGLPPGYRSEGGRIIAPDGTTVDTPEQAWAKSVATTQEGSNGKIKPPSDSWNDRNNADEPEKTPKYGDNEQGNKSDFSARQQKMLSDNVGYNVSPKSWVSKYSALGKEGTFLTDKQAIIDSIGEFKPGTYNDPALAAKLENDLGLTPGSLKDGFVITEVKGIKDMNPRSPTNYSGNPNFKGGGKGLPGGGPEMIVNPVQTKGDNTQGDNKDGTE